LNRSHCRQNWHQSDFVWEDTGENLSDYQRRLYRDKSFGYKVLSWLTSPILMTPLGALAGYVVGLVSGQPAGPVAGVCGAVSMVVGLGPIRHLRHAIAKRCRL
jgi:hypothetical protein